MTPLEQVTKIFEDYIDQNGQRHTTLKDAIKETAQVLVQQGLNAMLPGIGGDASLQVPSISSSCLPAPHTGSAPAGLFPALPTTVPTPKLSNSCQPTTALQKHLALLDLTCKSAPTAAQTASTRQDPLENLIQQAQISPRFVVKTPLVEPQKPILIPFSVPEKITNRMLLSFLHGIPFQPKNWQSVIIQERAPPPETVLLNFLYGLTYAKTPNCIYAILMFDNNDKKLFDKTYDPPWTRA